MSFLIDFEVNFLDDPEWSLEFPEPDEIQQLIKRLGPISPFPAGLLELHRREQRLALLRRGGRLDAPTHCGCRR